RLRNPAVRTEFEAAFPAPIARARIRRPVRQPTRQEAGAATAAHTPKGSFPGDFPASIASRSRAKAAKSADRKPESIESAARRVAARQPSRRHPKGRKATEVSHRRSPADACGRESRKVAADLPVDGQALCSSCSVGYVRAQSWYNASRTK